MAGVTQFIKLILRRDRVKLPVWLLGVVITLLAMVPMLRTVYGIDAELQTIYQTFSANPAGLVLTGPMDAPNFGAVMTIETLLWWGMAVVLMNTMFVVRHTRQNEELGAQELLLSGQAHRLSGLTAALIVALFMNVIVAVGLAVGLAVLDQSWTMESAWLYGISMGLFGLAWAAIAAVVAQFVQSARSANGALAGLMGATFLLRGVGDFLGKADSTGLWQPAWLSWLGPFGWLQATRSLTFPEWWPLWIFVGFIAVAVVVAYALQSVRDVGAGLLPTKKGRATASWFLKTPFGLTWRLQKKIWYGWAAGTFAMVATIGVMVPEMSSIYDSNANMKQMITAMGGTGAMVPAFLSAMLSLIALMVAAYAVQGMGKLRAEESSGHLENLLAAKLSRYKWISLHIAVVLVGSAVILAVSGWLLAVLVNAASQDFVASVFDYVLAGISYLPVVAVFVGIYVLLFGVMRRAAGLITWSYFGFVAFLTWIGPLLQLSDVIMNGSVMYHLATPPANEIDWVPLVIYSIAAVASITVGLTVWRSRDLGD